MDKYLRFIEHCKKKKYHSDEYLERHHVVPRHAGGSNSKDNLIKISLKDHILAHKIRHEVYKSPYDLSAYNYMMGQSAKGKKAICAANGAKSKGRKLTQEHKDKISKATSGENNPFYGKTHTSQVTERLKENSTGRRWKEETKQKLSKTLKSRPDITNPRKCKVKNVEYSSLTEAAKTLGIGKSLLRYRLDFAKWKEYEWIGPPTESKRPKNARKVRIDNVEYCSISQAASVLNLHSRTVSKRCNSLFYTNYVFIETC